jgi:hypothetical protein
MEKKAFYYSGTILWNNTHKHTRTHLEFWLIPNSFKDVPLMGLSEGAVIGTYLEIFRARYIIFAYTIAQPVFLFFYFCTYEFIYNFDFKMTNW